MPGKWEKPWNKRAAILVDEIDELQKSVELLYEGLSYPQDLAIMENDKELKEIYQTIYNGIEDLEYYMGDILDSLEEYEKPSIEKEPLWNVLERGREAEWD